MPKRFLKIWKYPSIIALIAANLVPILGVLYWEWTLLSIVLCYWLETAVICFYSILKIAKIQKHGVWTRRKNRIPQAISTYVPALSVYLFLLLLIFHAAGKEYQVVDSLFAFDDTMFGAFLTALSAMPGFLISHGVSFVQNFLGQREYEKIEPQQQVSAPSMRLIIMHIFILYGAIMLMEYGSFAALLVFIFVKTAIDAATHIATHARLVTRPTAK